MTQREIKFRAWKESKEMIFDSCKNIFTMAEGYTYSDFIIQQFTGLLDKNGKEIYEGDIVKRSDKKIGEVLFHFPDGQNNIFGWILKTQDSWYSLPAATFDGEIIGNIYESKHLLDNTDTKV